MPPDGAPESRVHEKVDPADLAHLASLTRTLRDQRAARGLSQRDVARLMGTTQSAVSEIETLSVCPTMRTLLRYARAVGAVVRFDVTPEG